MVLADQEHRETRPQRTPKAAEQDPQLSFAVFISHQPCSPWSRPLATQTTMRLKCTFLLERRTALYNILILSGRLATTVEFLTASICY
jgi:hypothetical protein